MFQWLSHSEERFCCARHKLTCFVSRESCASYLTTLSLLTNRFFLHYESATKVISLSCFVGANAWKMFWFIILAFLFCHHLCDARPPQIILWLESDSFKLLPGRSVLEQRDGTSDNRTSILGAPYDFRRRPKIELKPLDPTVVTTKVAYMAHQYIQCIAKCMAREPQT